MTAQIPAETLAELRVLLEGASPLPWEAEVLGSEGYELRAPKQAPPGSRIERRARIARCGYEDWQTDKANAALIAAAVNALPALLDALAAETARAEAAEAKVERASLLISKWRRPLDGARQRANDSDEFAEIYEREAIRLKHATEIAAALADEEDQ